MNQLKQDIIEAVQDATDLETNEVSIPILSNFLDGILPQTTAPSNDLAVFKKIVKRSVGSEVFKEWEQEFEKLKQKGGPGEDNNS